MTKNGISNYYGSMLTIVSLLCLMISLCAIYHLNGV